MTFSGYVKKIEVYVSEEERAELSAGFSAADGRLSETVRSFCFLGSDGRKESFVTACEPAVKLTGVRIVGDRAQDYIFAGTRLFGSGTFRRVRLRLTYDDNSFFDETAVISAYRFEDKAGKPERITVDIRLTAG